MRPRHAVFLLLLLIPIVHSTVRAQDSAGLTADEKQHVANIQSNANSTISTIKNNCQFSATKTNSRKRRKVDACIDRAIRERQQTMRLEDRLRVTAQREAVFAESDTVAPHSASRALLQSLQQDSGVISATPPGAVTGSTQAFVGGSLTGTPSTCGGTPGNGINNPALIRVHRMVMTPQVAMDDFGYRLGRRFIVYQVTVENGSKDFQFMLQDVTVDFSVQYGQLPGTYSYNASGQDLMLLRGVPEKGEDLDPRNRLLHVLQGIGSVAGAISGLTSFTDVMGSSVAIFNGAFLQGYTTIAPDHTGTQLNRLSDSAFTANTVIDKQRAKTIAMFIPADELMTHSEQKDFRKDPNAYLGFDDKTQSLNAADVCVDGVFIQAVAVAAPTLSSVTFGAGSSTTGGSQAVLSITGTNLAGGDTMLVVSGAIPSTAPVTASSDGKSGTVQVFLPTDFDPKTTTFTLQSKSNPTLNSGDGITLQAAPATPAGTVKP